MYTTESAVLGQVPAEASEEHQWLVDIATVLATTPQLLRTWIQVEGAAEFKVPLQQLQEMNNTDLAGITDMSKARTISRGKRGIAFFNLFKQVKEAREVFQAVCKACGVNDEENASWWSEQVDQQEVWTRSRVNITMFSAARTMYGEAADDKPKAEGLVAMLQQIDASPLELPAFVRLELQAMLKKDDPSAEATEPSAASPLPLPAAVEPAAESTVEPTAEPGEAAATAVTTPINPSRPRYGPGGVPVDASGREMKVTPPEALWEAAAERLQELPHDSTSESSDSDSDSS